LPFNKNNNEAQIQQIHQQDRPVKRLEGMNGKPIVETTGEMPTAEILVPPADVGALFDKHAGRLYRLARRLTPSADAAQDLVQQTFLKIAESSSRTSAGIANKEAWLVRVLINIRRDQWRKAATHRKLDSAWNVSTLPDRPDSDQESALIARTTVWRALDRLPPRRRAVIVMHELDGMPISEIASLLGVSAITARWHLSKGRHALSRLLKSHLER
jgi:RNA polymerase sigma-70 factor (ECF subfamily)